jgi:hypothetical protein
MTAAPDDLRIAAVDAVADLFRALDDHISARIYYDRDGPRHRGDNPPSSDDVQNAFTDAIVAIAATLSVQLAAPRRS